MDQQPGKLSGIINTGPIRSPVAISPGSKLFRASNAMPQRSTFDHDHRVFATWGRYSHVTAAVLDTCSRVQVMRHVDLTHLRLTTLSSNELMIHDVFQLPWASVQSRQLTAAR
ncbi:hypothetical protein AX14_013978 [Amanita brunnescens Koide BX004]|nr:hypothetical protein AX14_013978 [Amanita brunnescens Koide BX004]